MSDWSPGVQKVLDHVAETDGWQFKCLSPHDALHQRTYSLVRDADGCCPIESAAGFTPGCWSEAIKTLNLSRHEWTQIMGAADAAPSMGKLRAALLKAARLA